MAGKPSGPSWASVRSCWRAHFCPLSSRQELLRTFSGRPASLTRRILTAPSPPAPDRAWRRRPGGAHEQDGVAMRRLGTVDAQLHAPTRVLGMLLGQEAVEHVPHVAVQLF